MKKDYSEISYELIDGGLYSFDIGGALKYRADEVAFREYTGIGRSTEGMVVVDADISESLCQSSVIVGFMDGWEVV